MYNYKQIGNLSYLGFGSASPTLVFDCNRLPGRCWVAQKHEHKSQITAKEMKCLIGQTKNESKIFIHNKYIKDDSSSEINNQYYHKCLYLRLMGDQVKQR